MQQGSTNRDTSVQFSLKELRELEVRRIADEKDKVRATEEARLQSIADAAAAKLATEQAAAKLEHDRKVAIESARAESERQARLKFEAEQAAAKATRDAELEGIRMREELAIRRIEANKKRPKWMLAVTAVAAIATVVLVVFTVQAVNNSETSEKKASVATADRDAAIEARKASDAEITKLQDQMADVDARVASATKAVLEATDKASRDKAAADIKSAREAKNAADRALAAANAERERLKRLEGVKNLCIGQSVCKDTK